MGIFDKVKGCKILKEGSSAEREILELKEILANCAESDKEKIEQAIRNLEYGIKGEKSILFELQHSGFPMLVLRDLYLEYEGLSAQIDFLIITRTKNYIIECKNMYGDVTVSDTGEFYRKTNGKSNKIYSPITQCERHAELIKKIRYSAKSNIFMKMLFEKYGEANYCSLVVMANPVGKIGTKFAPRDIKKKIISADQLVRHIKQQHNKKEEGLEKDMIALGDFFLSIHKRNPQNYMEQYRKLKVQDIAEVEVVKVSEISKEEEPIICSRCGGIMVLRVAKRGDNKGKEFYGCSNYPKCRNIVQ